MARYFGHAVRLYRRVCYVEVRYSSHMARDCVVVAGMNYRKTFWRNSQITELLAIAAEYTHALLERAYRRPSRKPCSGPWSSFLAAPIPDQNSPLRVIRAKPKTRSRAEWT